MYDFYNFDEYVDCTWAVVLDASSKPEKECWFGRGPSGRLLGGGGTEDDIHIQIEEECQEFPEQQRKAWIAIRKAPPTWPAGQPGDDDPIALAADEGYSEVELPKDHKVWPLRLRNGETGYVLEYPDGWFSSLLRPEELPEHIDEARRSESQAKTAPF